MKICHQCGQHLAEEVTSCPSCGSEVRHGRDFIDDYRILEVLHEGYSSILCRAVREGSEHNVAIRIFTPQSGVNEDVASRLRKELTEIQNLPQEYFVQHLEIRQSEDGLWYRVSEWIEAEQNWASLLSSGLFQDYRFAFRFFSKLASILEGLHRIGHIVPHLILNDLIVFKPPPDTGGRLDVKIDYKVSRFLDPNLDRPGPLLKRLLACHPDIINRRPLDHRSDIWSLGKIFVELLSGDLEVLDFKAAIEKLTLPQEIEILLKTMLAEDPDMRPQSMAEVSMVFSRLKPRDIVAAERRRRRTPTAVDPVIRRAAVVLLLLAIGAVTWMVYTNTIRKKPLTLTDYANRYAASVAFVLVEYWIEGRDQLYYRNRSEGTAFLADKEGHLLTNRHVACPWLEDEGMLAVIGRIRQLQLPAQFGYRTYLWFEGQKAFKRLPALSDKPVLEDLYFLNTAYQSSGKQQLRIIGVAPPPSKSWQQIKSPLRDDFAVLKIEPPPGNRLPLPLHHRLNILKVPKLLPVIALGFPLGSQTQGDTVNVSVTRGHVRRAFESFLQVDTSIYRGNSGGPIIDTNGRVIGIASSVAVEFMPGPLPMATPLSDLGMILPITSAASFLDEIKAGKTKWNGEIDLALDVKMKRLLASARDRRWQEAQESADRELKTSLHPALVMAGAMLHTCAGDLAGAGKLFEQTLSIDTENDRARLMIFLLDWLENRSENSPYRSALVALDWQSPNELFGYLVDVLEGRTSKADALAGGYTAFEKSWLHFTAALKMQQSADDLKSFEETLRRAVLLADDTHWIHFLALADLDRYEEQQLSKTNTSDNLTAYQKNIMDFRQLIAANRKKQSEQRNRLLPLLDQLRRPDLKFPEKQAILLEIRAIDPLNTEILIGLIYENLIAGNWDGAVRFVEEYLSLPGRENIGKLRCGLLKAQLTHVKGQTALAQRQLQAFQNRITDPWYQAVARSLQGDLPEEQLLEKAALHPAYLLTAHTALGLWAEGDGKTAEALAHYRDALGTYRDDMVEFNLSAERIKVLRTTP